jgi:hypothetical protein
MGRPGTRVVVARQQQSMLWAWVRQQERRRMSQREVKELGRRRSRGCGQAGTRWTIPPQLALLARQPPIVVMPPIFQQKEHCLLQMGRGKLPARQRAVSGRGLPAPQKVLPQRDVDGGISSLQSTELSALCWARETKGGPPPTQEQQPPTFTMSCQHPSSTRRSRSSHSHHPSSLVSVLGGAGC